MALGHDKNKIYSLKSLIGMALQKWDSDVCWNTINKIRSRATVETVQLVFKFFKSRNWRKRALAVNIICQLMQKEQSTIYHPYAVEEAHKILYEALSDSNLQVVTTAIHGLGHRPCVATLPIIVNYATNDCTDVRYAVACALGSYKEEESINALLHLATDRDEDVRDWATFSLGSLHDDLDTPAIREVLWYNTKDSCDRVIAEAISGLAVRKDFRVIELLQSRLTADDCMACELETAEYLAEPSLYPYLEKLLEQYHANNEDSFWLDCLIKAMEACYQP